MSAPISQTGGHHCPCPQLDQFREGVQRSRWSQTTELLDHMDRCPHWLKDVRVRGAADCPSIPVQLPENCPDQRTTGVFRKLVDTHQWSALLDQRPAGSGQQGLKGLLLLASIRHDLGSLTLNILGSVTDSMVMEATRFAVHLKDKDSFLQMFQGCPRSRRVFRQKFVLQQWKYQQFEHSEFPSTSSIIIEGEVGWMYTTLYDAGEKDLALFVAGNSPHENQLIEEFCWVESMQFDAKQNMYRYALRKLLSRPSSYSFLCIVASIWADQGRSKADHSYIFRQAVRHEQHALLCALPEQTRILKSDLKFFTSWYFLENADYAHFFIICSRLGKEDIEWLESYGMKSAVETYFRDKPHSTLNSFTEQFPPDPDTPFFSILFRKAIENCVQSDCAEEYIRLCEARSKLLAPSVIEFKEEDLKSAYLSAINKRHFIQELCKRKSAEGGLANGSMNAILLLLDIVVKQRAWDVLPVLYHSLPSHNNVLFKFLLQLMEKCVVKMLADRSTWAGMAPALEQWIKEETIGVFPLMADSGKAVLYEEHWPHSASSLKQWCVVSGHVYLAFFLAVVTADWTLVETVVNSLDSLEVHHNTLLKAVTLASESGALSTCISMLKAFPVKAELIDISFHIFGKDRLVEACEEHGLLDWAMVLQCHDLDYIKQRLDSYHNQTVLNWIMKAAVDDRRWDIVRELMTECTDSEVLKFALQRALSFGPEDIVKALIIRVDPVSCKIYGRTLLETSVSYCRLEKRTEIASLCVASGLSTFQRHNCYQTPDRLLWDLQRDPRAGHLDIVKALLGSGTFSYKSLYAIAHDEQLQTRLISEGESEDWKQGYREICQAAATPCRLEHLARLEVSHSLGCQPGRDARINRLPLPSGLKDKVNFKDILQPVKEKED